MQPLLGSVGKWSFSNHFHLTLALIIASCLGVSHPLAMIDPRFNDRQRRSVGSITSVSFLVMAFEVAER